MKKYLILLTFITITNWIFGQYISTLTTVPINSLIQDTLIGNCILSSNVSANNGAYGYFNKMDSDFPFYSGIILSTGYINNAEGPDNNFAMGSSLFSGIDPDLQSLVLGFSSVTESSVIEFDFIPDNDEISFKYIFGSEEFPQYVNSDFNDVFGFFLSGPGINGPYSNNAINIALLPNGQSVTIDNIFNSASWYIGPSQWSSESGLAYNHSIQFNGATTILTASANVIPGQTYHIKLAIGDVGDGDYDSGVFIEAGSFTSVIGSIVNHTGTTLLDCYTREINVTAIGGNTYSWNNGITTAQNTFTSPGTYTVTITDINECYTTQRITITQNDSATNAQIINNSGTNVLNCDVRSINVTVTGGDAYIWNNGINTAQNTFTSPGIYSVTATINDRCPTSQSIIITEDITIPVGAIINHSGSSILNCNLNAISVTATGGNTYLWNNGTNTSQNTFTLPGTYIVTITASSMCTTTTSITITQDITMPDGSILNNTGTTILDCNNTSIRLTALGGSTYLWNNNVNVAQNIITSPGTYIVTITGNNGCIIVKDIEITQDIAIPDIGIINNTGTIVLDCDILAINVTATGGVSYIWNGGANTLSANNRFTNPGIYKVTATGTNGCINSKSIIITKVDNLNINISTTEILCKGGYSNITVNASGGFSPYTGTGTFNNISPGIYNYIVEDVNGCKGSKSINIIEPHKLNVDINIINHVSCYNGSDGRASAKVTGGVGSYNYKWNAPTLSDSRHINDLPSGIWSIEVTDDNNCYTKKEFAITQPSSPLNIEKTTTKDVTCNGGSNGSIQTIANGGVEPYNVYIYNQSTNMKEHFHDNLKAGNYLMLLKDNAGCEIYEEMSINQPNNIITNFIKKDPCCIGFHDGSIEIEVFGGIEPYTYRINDQISYSNHFDKLRQGIYKIHIYDANMCKFEMNEIILSDINKDCLIIPNAFSPNNDGINDTWILDGIENYPDAEVFIFNRWGQTIFESKGYKEAWNGKYENSYVPTATYIYTIKLFHEDIIHKGTVTVVY